jgi:hypothetical protein
MKRAAALVEAQVDHQRQRTAVPDRQRVAAVVDGRDLPEETDRQEDHFGRNKW